MISNKGQSRELINFFILILGVSVVLVIAFFLISSSRKNTDLLLIESSVYDRTLNAVNNFYYSKVSGTEVSLAQLLGDRIATDSSVVTYGYGYPPLNVDEMVTEFFDSYFDDRWKLEISDIEIGHKKPKNVNYIESFELQIPIPSYTQEIVKGYLYVWTK